MASARSHRATRDLARTKPSAPATVRYEWTGRREPRARQRSRHAATAIALPAAATLDAVLTRLDTKVAWTCLVVDRTWSARALRAARHAPVRAPPAAAPCSPDLTLLTLPHHCGQRLELARAKRHPTLLRIVRATALPRILAALRGIPLALARTAPQVRRGLQRPPATTVPPGEARSPRRADPRDGSAHQRVSQRSRWAAPGASERGSSAAPDRERYQANASTAATKMTSRTRELGPLRRAQGEI